jgi:phytoene/squalene synthetase
VAPEQLIDVIDAHAADLYTDREVDLDAYGAATDGAIIALAARILGGDNADAQHTATHVGIARVYAAAGQVEDARQHLDLMRDLVPRIPAGMLPALLPGATIRSSLGRETPLPLWRRQWLIWRAARDPQRMFG